MKLLVHCPAPWRFNKATKTVVSNQSHPICTLSADHHREIAVGQKTVVGDDGEFIAMAPAMYRRLALAKLSLLEGDFEGALLEVERGLLGLWRDENHAPQRAAD